VLIGNQSHDVILDVILIHHYLPLCFPDLSQAVQESSAHSRHLFIPDKQSSTAKMASLRLASSRGLRALRPVTTNANISRPAVSQRAYGSQGYGDGKGDPIASNPQKQPANTEATHSAEHPGPATPHMKGGKGGKTPEDASAESGGSRSKDAVEKGESPTAGRIGKKD
jgi:hypothetical protein